ncbi:MAG: transcription termination factor Rho [Clostridia bacterium]|nr:transcription termination factor Rho [Clostridia bacterium]
MYSFEELNEMTKDKLKEIAQGMEIEITSTTKKLDIINKIIENEKEKKSERPNNVTEKTGVLEVKDDGYGFLRFENFTASADDIYVSPTQIRRFNLKTGDEITGDCRITDEEGKSSPLLYVKKINGDPLEVALKRRPFEKRIPVFPEEKINLENSRDEYATRIIDLVAPIGKGQRGMIVAPPKAGKTTIIKSIAKAIEKSNPEIKLIILLIDERPEEVTDIKESTKSEVIYSTFDMPPENHCRVSELVLERAQRLVEQDKDVVILLDSITRLVRAYNLTEPGTGKTLTGGLDPSALYKPKKFFGAARNIKGGGSLTIIATALVETGSRMDDVIFEEFKGTGNMELKLDRVLQERRIFPAIDVVKSGTRREEMLISPDAVKAGWTLRRTISRDGNEGYVKALQLLRATDKNSEFVDFINKQNN